MFSRKSCFAALFCLFTFSLAADPIPYLVRRSGGLWRAPGKEGGVALACTDASFDLLAEVPDDTRCSPDDLRLPLSEGYRADSFEFWLGRRQYQLAQKDGRIRLYDYTLRREMPLLNGFYHYEKGAWRIAAQIPWSSLGIKFSAGDSATFAWQINNASSAGNVVRSFHPENAVWDRPSTYALIHFGGAENTGGTLAAPLKIDIRQFSHTPKVECRVQRRAGFEEGRFRYLLRRADDSIFHRGELPAGPGVQLLDLPVDPAGTGLYRIEFFLVADGTEFGPIPEPYFNPGDKPIRAYRSPRVAPEDMAAFWEKKIEAMRKRPFNAKIEPFEGKKNLVNRQITLENHRGNPMRIFVSYHKTDAGKRLPGLMNVYPPMRATGTQNQPGGVLTISFCGSLQGEFRPAGAERNALLWDRAEDLENCYWLDVVLDAVRVLDFVATLPECNGDFTVTGGSRGGWYSFAIGAVAPDKVKLASFTSPCYSDVTMNRELGAGSAASEVHQVFKRDELLTEGRIFANFRYFDPLFLAEMVRTRFVFSAGLTDNICSAIGMTAAANRIKPEFCYFVLDADGGHGGSPDIKAFQSFFQREARNP